MTGHPVNLAEDHQRPLATQIFEEVHLDQEVFDLDLRDLLIIPMEVHRGDHLVDLEVLHLSAISVLHFKTTDPVHLAKTDHPALNILTKVVIHRHFGIKIVDLEDHLAYQMEVLVADVTFGDEADKGMAAAVDDRRKEALSEVLPIK